MASKHSIWPHAHKEEMGWQHSMQHKTQKYEMTSNVRSIDHPFRPCSVPIFPQPKCNESTQPYRYRDGTLFGIAPISPRQKVIWANTTNRYRKHPFRCSTDIHHQKDMSLHNKPISTAPFSAQHRHSCISATRDLWRTARHVSGKLVLDERFLVQRQPINRCFSITQQCHTIISVSCARESIACNRPSKTHQPKGSTVVWYDTPMIYIPMYSE